MTFQVLSLTLAWLSRVPSDVLPHIRHFINKSYSNVQCCRRRKVKKVLYDSIRVWMISKIFEVDIRTVEKWTIARKMILFRQRLLSLLSLVLQELWKELVNFNDYRLLQL